jgi:hypothetical protein
MGDCAICFITCDDRESHEQTAHDWILMHCACCGAAWVPRCGGWHYRGTWSHRCRNGSVGWLAEELGNVCYPAPAMNPNTLENESMTRAVDSRLWLLR